jgi:hypothetical protein
VAKDLNLKEVYGAVISKFYNTSLEKIDFSNTIEAADQVLDFKHGSFNLRCIIISDSKVISQVVVDTSEKI